MLYNISFKGSVQRDLSQN